MHLRRLVISALLSALLTWVSWSMLMLSSMATNGTPPDFGGTFGAWLIITIIFYGIAGLVSDLQKIANTPRHNSDGPGKNPGDDHDADQH